MKPSTELVFILDKSGSMSGLEQDTLGGFNSMLVKQQQLDEPCLITTILFDHSVQLVHDRVDIQQIEPMTAEQYQAGGYTALLDALGMAINRISGIQENTPKAQRTDKVMLVIITDGEENSSREYQIAQIRSMIEQQQQRFNWEFVFLGANIDAIATADSFGINAENASNYIADSAGTELNFSVLQNTLTDFRLVAKDFNQQLNSIRKDVMSRRNSVDSSQP